MAEITYQVIQKPIEERLIDAACVYWEVEREYFTTNKGTKGESTLAYRKRVVGYLIKHNTSLSYEAIASKFGYSSYTRLMQGIDDLDFQKNVLRQLRDDLNQIQHLADKLDAEFITTSLKIITKKDLCLLRNTP